jgi:hypothetical protein
VFPDATARTLAPEELGVLERFARAGGTVVVLVPRPAEAQRALAAWLHLEPSDEPAPPLDAQRLDDPTGASVAVRWQGGATSGVAHLRVAAEPGLRSTAPGALEVATSGALLHWPLGAGAVWVAGPELAENRRLELDDNARLWGNLAAAGPIAFLEGHHVAALVPPISTHLQALAMQALLLALIFVLAVAPRLGPPRPTPTALERPLSDSVRALARLTARARVEPQLARALRQRLRALLQERHGIPTAFPSDEAARALATATGLAPEEWASFERAAEAAQQACTPAQLLALVQRAARLEARL